MDAYTEHWNLLWAVQRSVRYHARRQAFFGRWRRVTTGASVVFGSAAAAALVNAGGHTLALGAAFVVVLMSAVDMVAGTADMAIQHHDLRRRFLRLEAELETSGETATEADIHRWTRQRLGIEADEPPIYVGLDLLCENELARAYALSNRTQLTGWQRLTAHWLRWENLAAQGAAAV